MTPAGVAIVGMACVFPGAPDLASYWENVRDGVDAISEVPADRLDPLYFEGEDTTADRFYCRRGGFVDEHALFDPLRFGVMPAAAQGAEPDQLLALRIAADALEDAGYDESGIPNDATSVILGRGGYIGAGMTRLEQHVRGAQQLVEGLRSLLPNLSDEQLRGVKEAFQEQLSAYGPDTAIGLVPNLAASRVANRLNLGGSAYTVDAACASALVAVGHGCTELVSEQADLVLAGGVHLANNEAFWSVFCQLGALSPTEQIRPFHRSADGLLIGEGIGVVVLKRLADAVRDEDRVYAVINGVGVTSDGRSATLMTPAVDGQLRALERAWRQAERSPESIGLLEAHGTATPAGDAAELETIRRFFGAPSGGEDRAGLGSVKSMIGHTMPAAGAAGLIKAAMALHHGVLPPTLHCEEPNPLVDQTRFELLGSATPWNEKRLAGVNAFGFGGINAHVVLEAPAEATGSRRRRTTPGAAKDAIFVAAASDREELLAVLDGTARGGEGSCRLAIANPTSDRIALARKAVEQGKPRRGRDGIFFSADGLLGAGKGELAFLFPGAESEFEPRVDDVVAEFGFDPPQHTAPEDLEGRSVGVIEVGRLLNRAIQAAGVQADVVAGHSLGEWCGMIAAGILQEEDVDALLSTLTPGTLEVPGFVFAAVGCGAERAEKAIGGLSTVVVSHDNCPHQSILCGHSDEIGEALTRLRADRVLGQALEYPRGGFHTEAFRDYLPPYREALERLPMTPPRIPLWSATTCDHYPHEPAAIRELALDHIVQPVRFRELVLKLYESGVRGFVQIGTGNLVGFIDDVLRGKDYLAIPVNTPRMSGMQALRRTIAALFVEGREVDLGRVGLTSERAVSRSAPLALGVPLVRFDPLEGEVALRVVGQNGAETASDPLTSAIDGLMEELSQTRDAAMSLSESGAVRQRSSTSSQRAPAGANGASPNSGTAELVEEIELSVDAYPELVGHCLFPQPDGWSDLADRHPVVPMTMSLEILADAARRASGLNVVALEHVRAIKWLAVEPAVTVTLRASYDGDESVDVALDGYVEATARVAPTYPSSEGCDPIVLATPNLPPVRTGAELYDDRWMFHGPEYQGVVSLDGMGPAGIRGTLAPLPALGALLDAAGQLFGYWIMATEDKDRLSMPVRIERIEFFDDMPQVGELVSCAARVRNVGEQAVSADLELAVEERLFARITGWQDWRFETDERLWQVMQRPESNLLAVRSRDGYFEYLGMGRSTRSQDYLARRYLNASERLELDAMGAERQADWLAGRIAAKDAVRHVLCTRGVSAIYPVELTVVSDEQGRPRVMSPHDVDIEVSIAHKNGRAVALAAIGTSPGIDIEEIAHRSVAFVERAFSPDEVARVPNGDMDGWLTRFWSAREAVGKSRGTGLAGVGTHLAITAVDGDRVEVDGEWVETRQKGEMVVAWTT
jgi:acyl transferase domain-containing protein/phosphopantetheinyl transferase (holo-ACP synthase)